MSLIWNIFGPWIVVAILLLIIAFSLYGIVRLSRNHDWRSRENEVLRDDPSDRGRQQRERTEELRHSAEERTERQRRADRFRRTHEEGAARREHRDQVEEDARRLFGDDDEHTS